ncbi:MAG TPA: hypothetical protein VL091_12770 [Marinobacter sp.]|nr:hypothetical protein [Marinobacter sp.]
MFKELWRKLEQGFLQTDGSIIREEPGLPGLHNANGAGQFRIFPHITHTGEFHLERLTNLLKVRYGKRFDTSDNNSGSDTAIYDLISFAARIQDQDVQRELLLFYLNCSPVIQEYLRSETDLGDGHFFSR